MTYELVNARLQIFWDGEGKYYEAIVVGYTPQTRQHVVTYFADMGVTPRPMYDEDLSNSLGSNLLWKIFSGSVNTVKTTQVERTMPSRSCKPLAGSGVFAEITETRTRAPIPEYKLYHGYERMAVDAVLALASRKGSSFPAIRKYILANYRETTGLQITSFNKRTLDGINTAVR